MEKKLGISSRICNVWEATCDGEQTNKSGKKWGKTKEENGLLSEGLRS